MNTYIAVDKDGSEWIYDRCPEKGKVSYIPAEDHIALPKGSILKLIGRELTFEDEPIKLT